MGRKIRSEAGIAGRESGNGQAVVRSPTLGKPVSAEEPQAERT